MLTIAFGIVLAYLIIELLPSILAVVGTAALILVGLCMAVVAWLWVAHLLH